MNQLANPPTINPTTKRIISIEAKVLHFASGTIQF